MSEIYDLGEKLTQDSPVEVVQDNKDSDIFYPELHLSTESLPTLKGLKPNDRIVLKFVGDVVGIDVREKGSSYRIKLKKGSVMKEANNDKEADDDDIDKMEKAKSGQNPMDKIMEKEANKDEFPDPDDLKG